MGRALKWVLIGLVALSVIGVILIVANWATLQRIKRVQTMFEPDSIVHNFSHMDEVLFSQKLEASAEPHVWPETPESLPETVTIGGQDRTLSKFLDNTATTSLLVIRDGNILAEDYYLGTEQDDLRISWSVAKSFLSALMGQAVKSGQIKSLDDHVDSYVPSLTGSAYEGATIRNVLQMSSGVQFNEDYLDPKSDINKMGRVLGLGGSMDEFAATLKTQAYEPGTARQYVSIDTHVAGMVLRAATGKSVHQHFNETFGAKLGFGKAPYYLTDGEGVAFVLGGLNLRTRDYALFGQLMMQGGEWGGEQIIPASWAVKSTVPSAPDKDLDETGFGYGYQWWVQKPYQGDYHARGIYSQYIFIDPNTKMVIVKTSAQRNFEETAPSGKTYKLETIDMFRSLAQYYGGKVGIISESDVDETPVD